VCGSCRQDTVYWGELYQCLCSVLPTPMTMNKLVETTPSSPPTCAPQPRCHIATPPSTASAAPLPSPPPPLQTQSITSRPLLRFTTCPVCSVLIEPDRCTVTSYTCPRTPRRTGVSTSSTRGRSRFLGFRVHASGIEVSGLGTKKKILGLCIDAPCRVWRRL
jgi:hypothetical protein